jgi:lysophospholipase L1-like esterase
VSSVRAATLNVLPLGDSITAGYAYYTQGPGYREFLLNDLTNSGISIQYQGVRTASSSTDYGYSADLLGEGQNYNDGFVGYGSADILNNLAGDVPSTYINYSNDGGYWLTGGNGTGRSAMFPDIVLLIIGSNDMSGRGGAVTIEPNDLGILNWFKTNRPNTQVIIAAPPPGNGATDLPQTQLVNSYLNSIVPSMFPEDRVANVYQTMLNLDGTVNLSRVSPDGLHPLAVGYTSIAEALYSAISASTPNTAKTQVQVGALSISGSIGQWTSQIDLKSQDLIDVVGNLATITDQVRSGFAGGTWTGNGLTSSAAAANTTHLMALGILQNNTSSGSNSSSGTAIYPIFDGIASTSVDVLVKYTHFGDANLDGTVDALDYAMIDDGYLNHLTGWSNGDFNYDGVINGSDYALMDNSFNAQAVQSNSAISTAQIDPASTGVPEPVFAPVAIAAVGMLRRRPRGMR